VIAGAQSQVTTLWKVNDEGTRRFMEVSYRRLAAGEPRSEALRQVQLEMMKTPDYRHPSFWASFVPIGAWGPVDLTGTSGSKQ
jgi:CHAT domain-containing protein